MFFAVVGMCMNVADETARATSTAASLQKQQEVRAGDSLWVTQHVANDGQLPVADALHLDSAIHRLGLNTPHAASHDSAHEEHVRYVNAALDSASAWLHRKKGPVWTKGVLFLRNVNDPLTPIQLQRKNALAAIIKRAKGREDVSVGTAARKAYAEIVENGLLSKGFNVDVTVSGPANTTLRIKWVLVSKVTAYEFANGEYISTLKQHGFKRFVLTDGYDETWTWNLTK